MRKIFTLLILLLLLPVTALAAGEDAPGTLYVGNQRFIVGSEITYWTTDANGTLTQSNENGTWNVKYDPSTATLTLRGASIQGGSNTVSAPYGSGIYALSRSGQPVSLTIELIGTNTITGNYGIYVDAQQGGTVGTNASLLIRNSSDNGILEVSGSFYGIYVKSGTGDASLNINDASVVAKTTQTNSGYAGVCVQSGSDATRSPQLSLAVNGGSLTASASEGNVGIQFYVGSSEATGATTSLTVSDNAIVRANGGIKASRVDEPTPSGTGIVFDGTKGTVYGNVTLDEPLTVGEGETLTIPQGSTLNGNSNLTNNGTVTIENGGTLNSSDAINNTGTINVENGGNLGGTPTGGTVVKAPVITTESPLPEGTVGTEYNQPLAADNSPTQWTVTSGTLPDGLSLDAATGIISGTPTTEETSTFTVTATNNVGSASKEYTLNIKAVSVTGVTLDPTELSLYTGESKPLTATVQPADATNQDVTWSSNNNAVATVENGTVKAVGEGEATITVTTAEGSYTATCAVKVTDPVYSMTTDLATLDFAAAYTGYDQPAAKTVTITNTGNQSLTLEQPASTNSFEVGNLSKTELAPNEKATFTVQPKADLPVGTYSEDITVSSSEGATVTIPTSFNVRKEVKVEPSGSTNLSFTTDRDEFSLTATVHAQGNDLNPKDGSWTWTVADADVVALSGSPTWRSQSYSISRQAFTIEGTGTTTITAIYDDGTYRGSVDFTVQISKPSPPDPISYYNIYVEDVCDGVEVSTSKQVVREGGSINVYVEKDTANYTFDNFHVYYKEGYYDSWDELKEGTQPGEYPIKNIWTHIYIKAEGAEEKEDPTGIEQIEGVKVYTKDGSLYVQTPQREQVIIVSMSGAVVKNEEQIGLKQYHGLQPGIYIVRVGDRAYKVRLN